ncbi:L,D-transpeptidase family protein [Streptomyces sp. NPDC004393]|uniref:L,D-transpeptidase n=1 Tax=Streptomyces sp. NPDC004533 TaxID=3154278 RepID=UPI0033BC9F3F
MSDDLTTGLRALAESGQMPPRVSGAEVRRRAGVLRRRRRAATAAAGVSVVTALGVSLLFSLTGTDRQERPSPAAPPTSTPSTPSTRAEPSATVYLAKRVLLVGDRALPVSAGAFDTRTPTGRMTVTARQGITTLSAEDLRIKGGAGGEADVKIPWVVELRADDGTSTFIGALTYDFKAPGNYDTTGGWIGLGLSDAKWLYTRLRVGDVVLVEDGGSTPEPTLTSATGRPPEPTLTSATGRPPEPTARVTEGTGARVVPSPESGTGGSG